MQNRSSLYDKMMRSDLRDVAIASIYIGAINQKAQSEASVHGDFWRYSNIQSPIESDSVVDKRYFTWEEKTNKLDGTMYLLPETEEEVIYNNGIVTEEICTDELKPAVLFMFQTKSLDVKGLTIEFGESFPLDFMIETNVDTKTYVADSRFFMTEDVFENIDYMRIIPGHMSHGYTRFRIEKIMFGIGIYLTGNRILDMTIKETTHPISLDLPTVDFKFKVDNLDRYFNANADYSVINFLERGQEVKAVFSQTLEDGTKETIDAANVVLDSTWKDKGTTAEFTATDILCQMDGIYDDGIFRKEGITAYLLLKDVFSKAGMEEDEYQIDPYLKKIVIHNPLPKDTFANCILLIANACRCVMRQDRHRKIIIKSSFKPELNATAEPEAIYSHADKILENQEAASYFEWQMKYNRLDGEMFWKPEGKEYHYAGYVSDQISNANGLFNSNPVVTVSASAAFDFYQLTLQFGNVFPKKILIHCYCNDVESESFYSDIVSKKHVINRAFIGVDTIKVEFVEAAPYNRIHLQGISLDDATDFTIYRNDMFANPVTERQERLKDLTVIKSVYSMGTKIEEIFSDMVMIAYGMAELKLEFNDASIPDSIITAIPSQDETNPEEVTVDYGAKIVRYSNWYCMVKFENPPVELKKIRLKVMGYKYKISNPKYVLNVNTTGTNLDALQNPLIDDQDMAEKYANWCADYYQAKAEYSMTKMMGNPILESNDLAYYEDEDGTIRLIRIHTVNLKFDGTYNGSSCSGRSV